MKIKLKKIEDLVQENGDANSSYPVVYKRFRVVELENNLDLDIGQVLFEEDVKAIIASKKYEVTVLA